MLLCELVSTSAEVTGTRSRRLKVELLAACLGRMDTDEVAVGASYLAGTPRQERLNVGWATVREAEVAPASESTLALLDVHAALDELAGAGGTGSGMARRQVLQRLMGAATAEGQRFIRGLVLGDLRQGALAGIAAQAIAAAWNVTELEVRRALMLSGDLGVVAEAAATGGRAALAAFRLTPFTPLQPMLAQTVPGPSEAIGELGSAAVEYKLDGARVQAHRAGDDVRVYTRNLRDVTARSPEVVAAVLALPVDTIVLDGEVIALRPDGRPQPFQDTMGRFGSDLEADHRRGEIALTPFFFDVLHLDGEDLLDRPLADRAAALARVVPDEQRVPSHVVDRSEDAEAVMAEALARGHEGVMVKSLDAPYEAGRRGAAWRKVKPVHTLDLVVLAVEWGSGRRKGWLSNLHLGARDVGTGDFVMLGKTFKGLTDELLEWQTRRLLELEVSRDRHIVHVRPELVVEIALDGVQRSPRYPAGLTLRFARVKRYRDDKTAAEADTVDTVRAIHTPDSSASGAELDRDR